MSGLTPGELGHLHVGDCLKPGHDLMPTPNSANPSSSSSPVSAYGLGTQEAPLLGPTSEEPLKGEERFNLPSMKLQGEASHPCCPPHGHALSSSAGSQHPRCAPIPNLCPKLPSLPS